MLLPPGKSFSLHLTFNNADEKDPTIYTVSVSNLVKSTKTISSKHTIRVDMNHKWTTLCVNLGEIAKSVFKVDSHLLNSIQLNG